MKLPASAAFEFQDVTFREISSRDLSLVNRLLREGKAYWGYDEAGLDRFMRTYGIANETYFDNTFGSVAEFLHEPLGYYLFKIHEKEVELDHLFLDTKFIGQGYGRHLWNHCVEVAHQKSWREFTFTSDPYSRGFYESMGAVQIDEKPSVILMGQMVPIMRFTVRSSCVL